MVPNGYKWVNPGYNASMMTLAGQVRKHSDLPSGALAYSYQTQKHEHSYPDRALAKFFEAVSPATGKYLAVDVRINAGRWT